MIKTKEIQKWRIDSGVTNEMIAQDVGLTGPYVSMVINGTRKSDAVVSAFIKRGCPSEYFETRKKCRQK